MKMKKINKPLVKNSKNFLDPIKSLINQFRWFKVFLIKSINYLKFKQIYHNLLQISKDHKPIVVGPWLSEVGFEILYWVPFLRWIIQKYKIDPNRIWVISRGGAKIWYEGFNKNYMDILDLYEQGEFKQKNKQRILRTNIEKQISFDIFDKEILKKFESKQKITSYHLLHPHIMYHLFDDYWNQRKSIKLITDHTIFNRYSKSILNGLRLDLPLKYIAVKFYYNPSFPNNDNNNQFFQNIIKLLTLNNYVILLNTSLKIDDHGEQKINSDKVIKIENIINPQNNIEIQTKIVSGASAFFGTYGGFSYLPVFLGVPSYSFYSEIDKFVPEHLDVINRVCHILNFKYSSVKSHHQNDFNINNIIEYCAMSVNNYKLIYKIIKKI